MKLKNKVCIITGATSGMGKAIAKLTLFLASEDASWITGTAMTIDGGILNA